MATIKAEKPYRFDTITKPVTQTDFAMWRLILWEYLKSLPGSRKLIQKDLTWTRDETTNFGFVNDDAGDGALTAAQKVDHLESILLKIGTYGPKSIFIDITQRHTSYNDIWDHVKNVCGFSVTGTQIIEYMAVKHSFDPAGKESFNDLYYRMRELKIASLMTSSSKIKFNGKDLPSDEAITPSLENGVVADWLEDIGGVRLVKYVGQLYSKELEKICLFDLQKTIGKQEVLQTILDKLEGDNVASINRSKVGFSNRGGFNKRGSGRGNYENKTCYFCKELWQDH